MAMTMSRQQLATRIHKLLLREIGHDIEIGRLLDDTRYARDVLLVCDAVPGGEGVPLADLFRAATLSAIGPRTAPGHAPQANEWGRDTSGFGLSQPPPLATLPGELSGRVDAGSARAPPAEGERRRGWLPRWLGRKT